MYHYNIAEHIVRIGFAEGQGNSMALLPSFRFFECEANESSECLFTLFVDDALVPIDARHGAKLIKVFETGNGDTSVERLPDGGYQYFIKNLAGEACCLLQTDKDFHECKCALRGNYAQRCFGINNAVMLCFAFAGADKSTMLIHASCICCGEEAYAFLAKSGTGKSTHTSLWLRNVEGCELLNDDNPVVRIIDGKSFIYGSPWSGKTPCYRNIKARLGGMAQIERSQENKLQPLSVIDSFTRLVMSISSMRWDRDIFLKTCDNISAIIESTPVYDMYCRPDREAALVSSNGMMWKAKV